MCGMCYEPKKSTRESCSDNPLFETRITFKIIVVSITQLLRYAYYEKGIKNTSITSDFCRRKSKF